MEKMIHGSLMVENDKLSLLGALQIWREQDHEDHIVLSRHEVITILEEVKKILPR